MENVSFEEKGHEISLIHTYGIHKTEEHVILKT